MTAIHLLSEQIIEDEKAVMAPPYDIIGSKLLSFEKVELEKRIERKDIQPDIVGETPDGLRWFIEIRNTHEVDNEKKNKILASGITCIEIDVREQNLENLRNFLLESVENRIWINNNNYEEIIIEEKRRIVSIVSNSFVKDQSILIPAYTDYGSRMIRIGNNPESTKYENGLCVTIKVISDNTETAFLFIIGYREFAEQIMADYKRKKECNVLFISMDDLSPDEDIQVNNLDIQWIYHHTSAKEKEKKLSDYKSNPKYEIKESLYCGTQCKYKPFIGQCIYLQERISDEENDYVICNKEKRIKDEENTESKRTSNIVSDVSISKSFVNENFDVNPIRINNNKKKRKPKQKDELYIPFDENTTDVSPTNNSLIDVFYQRLQLHKSYVTEQGIKAEIINFEKNEKGDRITVLYKETSTKWYPYHVAFILVENDKIIKNKVGDYLNESAALKGYNDKIKDSNK